MSNRITTKDPVRQQPFFGPGAIVIPLRKGIGMADEESAGDRDKRWGVRVPLGVLGTIRVGQGERLAKIRDISISGCFIETSLPYPLGATVGLSFALDPDHQQPVTTDAKVTTCTKNGIGVRFIYNDADTPLMVRRWITSRRPAA